MPTLLLVGALKFSGIYTTASTVQNLNSPQSRRPYSLMMKWLGNKGLRALERLMGMLLIMLATQMMLDGLGEFLAGLNSAS